MRWARHGVVWRPDGSMPWARSHATCPTPLVRRDGSLRLYLQCRDDAGVGRIGWIDVDPDDPRRVIRHAADPVLDVGAPGAFDDNGVFQTSVLRMPDGQLRLYYVGFELCHHIRYRLLTGLAISTDDGDSFTRVRSTPILERSDAEPHFRCGAHVRQDGGRFRMWYVAGGGWETIGGKALPRYDIRHAESADGIAWPDEGRVVLPITRADEHGFGRPFVRREGAGWRMHYSIRKRAPAAYRLGLAGSADGLAWERCDSELGLEPVPGAWDGTSQAYAAEVDSGGRTWLFYNGDDFGGTGVGVAERLEP